MGVIASAAIPIVVVTAATLVTTCISVVASVIVANDCTVSYTGTLVLITLDWILDIYIQSENY